MINSITIEGYIANAPVNKAKFEGEEEYIRFDLAHYSKFGGLIHLACICTNPKTIEFMQCHVHKNDRVIVLGVYNQYKYKNPAGKDKIIHSIMINAYDGVKLLENLEIQEIDQKQKHGFPGGNVQETLP